MIGVVRGISVVFLLALCGMPVSDASSMSSLSAPGTVDVQLSMNWRFRGGNVL